MKFLSNQWVETAKKIATKKLDPKKDLKKATTSLLNIIENIPPDGRSIYFYISVNNGNLDEMLIDQTGSLLKRKAEFVVTGNYDTFVQIFKGDKVKALQFLKPIDRLNGCLREIETEY